MHTHTNSRTSGHLLPSLILALIGCFLAACGSDNDNSSETPPATVSAQSLVYAGTEQAFVSAYKSMLTKQHSSSYRGIDAPQLSSPDSANAEAGNPFLDGVSDTNLVVAGVDELDFIKHDVSNIYAIQRDYPNTDNNWQGADKLLIYSADNTSKPTNSLPLTATYNQGMYLTQNESGSQLITLGTAAGNNYYADILPNYYPNQQETTIEFLSATSASQTALLKIEGQLFTSRLINDRLIVVTSFTPEIYNTPTGKGENELIADLSSDQIMPDYTRDKNAPTRLVNAENCLLPASVDNAGIYYAPQIMTVTTIDVNSTQIIDSICTTASADAFHITKSSLYFTEPADRSTLVHKFSISEKGTTYEASGSVSGYISGGAYSFRLHEKDNYLFAVSTQWTTNGAGPEHQFSVLADNHNQTGLLQTVATLPNADQPKVIGKPGEDIYGVRFNKDSAYLVTFQRTDPLYVIDTTTPESPAIVGELELPGFSDYLHLLTDDLLLGIGYTGVFPNRALVNLFDVGNAFQPSLISQLTYNDIDDPNLPVTWDHHAIAVEQTELTAKVAFPIISYGAINFEDSVDRAEPTSDISSDSLVAYPKTYLSFTEVDLVNKQIPTPLLIPVSDNLNNSYYHRVIIGGQKLYYINNGVIWELAVP